MVVEPVLVAPVLLLLELLTLVLVAPAVLLLLELLALVLVAPVLLAMCYEHQCKKHIASCTMGYDISDMSIGQIHSGIVFCVLSP